MSQIFKQESNEQKWQNICALVLFVSILYMIHAFVYVPLGIDTVSSSLFLALDPLIAALLFLLEICFKSKELRFYKFYLSYLLPILIFIFASIDVAPYHEWIAFIICYIPTFISMAISICDIFRYNTKGNLAGPMLYTISSLWSLILICFEP